MLFSHFDPKYGKHTALVIKNTGVKNRRVLNQRFSYARHATRYHCTGPTSYLYIIFIFLRYILQFFVKIARVGTGESWTRNFSYARQTRYHYTHPMSCFYIIFIFCMIQLAIFIVNIVLASRESTIFCIPGLHATTVPVLPVY